MSLSDVREGFLSYFEQHNHQRLHFPITNERMPVIARWRTDIYLTIASIADFQPHVTSGEVPPPANPLVISHPCNTFKAITGINNIQWIVCILFICNSIGSSRICFHVHKHKRCDFKTFCNYF